MSYATVMVHGDVGGGLAGRVDIAASLAVRLGARLIGIAGWAPMSLVVGEPPPTEFHHQDMTTLLDQKGREFCAAVGKRGHSAEWRSILELPTEAVAHAARAADLVVIGRERDTGNPFRALDPGKIILNAGRPVLVVPKAGSSLLPRRALIAWKDVREARRAVHDALPLLQQAESVMIVEVLEQGAGNEALQRVQDVAGYLARHGIGAIAERVRPADLTVINSLLRLIEDENIDLIVAGAYGHSRLGEFVFGGVTHDLLAESPICCLFSH